MKNREVIQPIDENSCGAYALAYWMWDCQNDAVESKKEVDKLYEKIKFGEDYDGIEDYSNPVKIMDIIREVGYFCTFYLGKNAGILKIYQQIKEKKETNDYIPSEYSFELKDGDAGIEIMKVDEGLHYIYVFMEGGTLFYINPWDGICKEYQKGTIQEKIRGITVDMEHTGAGIVIHPKTEAKH